MYSARMRILFYLFMAAAALIAGCAILFYFYATRLACGYAPGSSACRSLPWELGSDDRFWLVQLPSLIVLILLALAYLAHRKAKRTASEQRAPQVDPAPRDLL